MDVLVVVEMDVVGVRAVLVGGVEDGVFLVLGELGFL